MTPLLARPPEGVLDQSAQLFCSAVNGLIQDRCPVRDRDGPAVFDAGFHHATHAVIATLFVAVLITQVDLHSRDVLADSAQGTLHCATT